MMVVAFRAGLGDIVATLKFPQDTVCIAVLRHEVVTLNIGLLTAIELNIELKN